MAEKGVENSSMADADPPGPTVAGSSRPIFISYASPDAAVAQRLCAALEAASFRCWIAPRDVVPGTVYADGIVGAIDESRVLVLILSKDAVASAHVGRELERAASKRHPIIALKVDAAPLTRAFEYFLNQSHWIEARSGRLEAAVPQLVEAVCRHLDASAPVQSPSPVPLSAGSRATALPLAKWMLAGGITIVSLGLAYFVIDHFRQANHKPATTVSTAGDRGVEAKSEQTTEAQSPPAASIAVLPFSDLSAEGNQGYFSDGMSEEILNVLAHVNGLKVASRTSSFQFRKTDLGAPAIAARLGVRHILEGSVRKAGNTVRVTAQLIDASTDQHLWSQSFDRPMSTANLFAIQDEIAKNIVDKLAASIGPTADIAALTARKADTADQDAYDLYLKGRSLFIARSKSNLIEAARVLKAAVAKDPKFARAWEMLGAVLVTGKYWDAGDENDFKAGSVALDMALRLDPNLSLAYAARSEVQADMVPAHGAASWEDSLESLSRAVEHDGNNATAYLWRAETYMALGYLDRAIQDYQRSLDIDPAHEVCRRHLAMTYLYLGRTDDALRLLEIGWENGYFFNDVIFASAVAGRGDRLGALGILAREYQDDPQLIRPLYRALTDPAFSARDRKDAVALANSAKNSSNFIPSALLILKAYDSDKIVVVNDDPPIWWARDDGEWLKSASRKRAMQYWHLPEYWRKHGFPPQCRPIGDSDFECR